MKKTFKINMDENGAFYRYIKWRYCLYIFACFILIILITYFSYNAWEKSVTSPSEKTEFAFTVAPGGGGKGDRLVSNPVSGGLFSRIGTDKTYINLHFGPWEKAVKINEIEIHPMIRVPNDSSINVTLSLEGEEYEIGNFFAKGVYIQQLGESTTAIVGASAHISKSFENLKVPAGVSGTINLISQNTSSMDIDTNTYVWFSVLIARSAPVGSWWNAINNNPLVVGVFLVFLPILIREIAYETENERRQKKQIVILQEIEKHLRK